MFLQTFVIFSNVLIFKTVLSNDNASTHGKLKDYSHAYTKSKCRVEVTPDVEPFPYTFTLLKAIVSLSCRHNSSRGSIIFLQCVCRRPAFKTKLMHFCVNFSAFVLVFLYCFLSFSYCRTRECMYRTSPNV